MVARFISNADFLLRAMLERGLSSAEASKSAGINPDHFSRLLSADRPIRCTTAAKLKNFFGDEAITIATPRRIERRWKGGDLSRE